MVDKQKEIQAAIIRVTAGLLAPLDLTKPNQSISLIGLHQMLRDIPRDEFIQALKNMEGVRFLNREVQIDVQIPSKHFI